MKAEYVYTIQYQEVDAQRKLRLHTLENFLLQVAGLVADEHGYGIRYLYPQGLTWIIARLSMEVIYLPTHGEQIAIETWVEQAQHMLSTRCYRVWLIEADKNRKLIAKAKSQWAVLDLKKREIVNVFNQPAFANTVDGEVLEMSRPQRMNSSQIPAQRTYNICYSDVDYNLHCNSCKYLEHMLDTAYRTWFSDAIHLDITYQKEVKMDEKVTIGYSEQEEQIEYAFRNNAGELCCSCKISKLKNQDC